MPHSPQEKSALRACRIQGQAWRWSAPSTTARNAARCCNSWRPCGAATGLMAEVLESHLRETFAQSAQAPAPTADADAEIDQIMRIVRTYLK